MGKYSIIVTQRADNDLKHWHQSGNKSVQRKIEKIFNELREHPTKGSGKPEQLKGELSKYWSRRLNKKDRLIYRIDENVVIVYILSLCGHYDDT